MESGDIEETENQQIQHSIVMEEKIYVAVSRDVKESKSTLLWALQNFVGRKFCLLHVHQPAQMIPISNLSLPLYFLSVFFFFKVLLPLIVLLYV